MTLDPFRKIYPGKIIVAGGYKLENSAEAIASGELVGLCTHPALKQGAYVDLQATRTSLPLAAGSCPTPTSPPHPPTHLLTCRPHGPHCLWPLVPVQPRPAETLSAGRPTQPLRPVHLLFAGRGG